MNCSYNHMLWYIQLLTVVTFDVAEKVTLIVLSIIMNQREQTK
jgi:hypothetical protein